MRAVYFHSKDCIHVAVMGNPGRKFTKMVVIDHPVHLTTILNDASEKHSRDMTDLTVKQLCRRMLASGRRMGITKGARLLLKEGLNELVPPRAE